MSQAPKGIIAWFAHNHVAANLLMGMIMLAGLVTATTIKKEVFPEFAIDVVSITVPYRGGNPQEVEEGVTIRIEEAIQSIEGIKKITSFSWEGASRVRVEMNPGYDMQKFVNQIKTQVDAISTFPGETENPIIEQLIARGQVLWVNVYGDVDEITLKRLANKVRDEITALPNVSQAEVRGTRRFEISIEVSEEKLREYGLTFSQVAQAVRNTSLDLPAGSIKTETGEILLRTKGQAYTGEEYQNLVLLTQKDGSRILLRDVAKVIDGFEDANFSVEFNGLRSAGIQVFRVGEQNALEVAKSVKEYVKKARTQMPDGIHLEIWADSSRFLQERLSMLLRNGLSGLFLVFVSLTLFLRLRLALWVCLGIPLSFLGALWLMPMPFMDISINMITLFGFIVVLGIVVDDAIVVGENVYTTFRKEGPGVLSAIKGAQEVAVPVTFGVLTTIVAFIPMLTVPGAAGKLWKGIGLVVIATLFFSLIESKLILPAHLSTMKRREQDKAKLNPFTRFQRFFGDALQKWITKIYQPALIKATIHRYTTLALFVGLLLLSMGLLGGQWVRFVFFPSIESDFTEANLTLAEGTPASFTKKIAKRMEKALLEVNEEAIEETNNALIQNRLLIFENDNELEFIVELAPSENRSINATEINNRWRKKIGNIPGVSSLTFRGTISTSGDPINVQLYSANPEQLETATNALKEKLKEYSGVFDINDSLSKGKQEIKLAIKPQAQSLGLSLFDLARQVRQGFYGEQVQRIQRGRDDLRVMVRYPKNKRESIGDLESMRIRTTSGKEIPFSHVAEATVGRGYSSIRRVDRKRVVNVTADIDKGKISPGTVQKDIKEEILPEILKQFPEVSSSQEGEAREKEEAMASLARWGGLSAFLIYALMAIPLRSHTLPLIIMSVIPFGLIGAIVGHIIMGIPISILSLCGMIALAGVVVNDSLVLVDYINRSIRKGISLSQAVLRAGSARFRAILLTSVTTFAGLSPLLFEKSLQAQILIPMAVSLAFGVLFATAITLFLVPCLYLILFDLKALFSRKSASEIAALNTKND
jgi:multidrug efflux pump subunit AcrB